MKDIVLPPRQSDTFQFMWRYFNANGYPPTQQETAEFLGVTQNTASSHIAALERKGVIERVRGASRAVKFKRGMLLQDVPL